jgi:hypothetical protein
MVASNGIGKARPYQARLFTQCMQAKGYQWLVEPRVSHSLKNAEPIRTVSPTPCSGQFSPKKTRLNPPNVNEQYEIENHCKTAV